MNLAATSPTSEAKPTDQQQQPLITTNATSIGSQVAPAALPALILSGIGQSPQQLVIVNPSAALPGQQLLLPATNQASVY